MEDVSATAGLLVVNVLWRLSLSLPLPWLFLLPSPSLPPLLDSGALSSPPPKEATRRRLELFFFEMAAKASLSSSSEELLPSSNPLRGLPRRRVIVFNLSDSYGYDNRSPGNKAEFNLTCTNSWQWPQW